MLNKRYRRADAILAAAVLAVALAAAVLLWLLPKTGTAAEITVDGATVATLPLDTDTTYTVEGIGGHNTVVVRGGKVTVTDADCPDKICVRHRAVSRTGESIICLPHRVVVTVIGGTEAVDGEV